MDRLGGVESSPEIDDVDSFVQELTGCQDDLILFIRTICGDFHLAADIRQEVNMVLWRKRGKFAPGTSFRSWAYRIAHLEVKNHFRQTKRRSVTSLDPELLDYFAAELPASTDELPERRRALQGCMERLTPKDHELIRHRYWSESSLEILASSSDRSIGTLKARLFQLRAALRLCISERLSEVSA
ncbi:sigma-70 family RNA polymerase sigma factor [Luteolibacter yonseiensis]|uniref:Sigma-70 family RNA polymerase sigma factor n=1 Tax=Luteolibacter yonseiensis TaxID=1144680 RepID=A0A934R9Q3_9BACT|nr:sigma-70 family RNA polymerase sigma factor [Luteolibacter yonseiensis]MBK1817765.1 sigma-70 family RNA polymerase sigma factor [Luteolibacter yonseiensis]